MGYLDPELDMGIPSCTWSQYAWLWPFGPARYGASVLWGLMVLWDTPKGVPNRVIPRVPGPQIHGSEGSEDLQMA
jgi:hypothetical protein